jgi:hypothetical protein
LEKKESESEDRTKKKVDSRKDRRKEVEIRVTEEEDTEEEKMTGGITLETAKKKEIGLY